jgi:tetratricopeptide (TPR) repeat protein
MAEEEVTLNEQFEKIPVRVGIYTIALNEEQFVERWYESAKDADYLLIADTGSSDNTMGVAHNLGIHVSEISVKPWRFDTARNVAMALMPANLDYCIALDMDEILLPGWKDELQKAHDLKSTRPRYQYTWSWKDAAETLPSLQYGGDKIHSRYGYIWRHPVHEVMNRYGEEPETQHWVGLEIHHHPDNTKPRSQYLPLLRQSVVEDPHDDRNAFYYARELYFYKNYEDSIQEFKRHLALPSAVWAPERAASMRYLSKMEPENQESWLVQAVNQAPGRRESLVELAQFYYEQEEWENCRNYAIEACRIDEKPLEYLCEDFAWGDLPWDLAAISSYRTGRYQEAVNYNDKAIELNPKDKRLGINSLHYKKALENS